MSPLAANACCNIRLGDVAFLDAIKDTLSAAKGPISLGSDGFALQAVNQAVSNMTQMTQGAASTMPAPQLNGVARCLAFCEGSWLPAYLRAACMFRRLHILGKVVGRCCML